jgi:predicted nucleic acid-binding protein
MRTVFADSGYWIAQIDPKDDLHAKVNEVSKRLHPLHIVTSEMVLVEVLNIFCQTQAVRKAAGTAVHAITSDANVTVIPQTRDLFRRALDLYRGRLDKDWSVTDCSSFLIMQDRGISDALAYDYHFEQAGFKALLR